MRFIAWVVMASLGFVVLRLAITVALLAYLALLFWSLVTQPAATLGLLSYFALAAAIKAHPIGLGALVAWLLIFGGRLHR